MNAVRAQLPIGASLITLSLRSHSGSSFDGSCVRASMVINRGRFDGVWLGCAVQDEHSLDGAFDRNSNSQEVVAELGCAFPIKNP